MKLIDHVLNIRQLIARAFSNRFERLGLGVEAESDMPLTEDDKALRRRLKAIIDYHAKSKESYAEARKTAVNECTFTLFNRLAAIKVMEDKEFFPEIIARRAEFGGRSFEHNAWLEQHPQGRSMEREGLLPFFEDSFAEIAENFQFPIFDSQYPYALMPRADELNEIIDAFNAVSADPDCGDDIWRGDDILGWLYENFNAVEKAQLKESGEKTEYDKVSLQSQVYTPQWVVKFLVDNTVGKMYLEMHPESNFDRQIDENTGELKYRIANRPIEKTRNEKPLEKWRIIDPACGSGNFLIYTMTLLYDLYMDQAENFGADYSRRDIPALIVENNLYGVDLDERAVQISQIALRIKARELGGRRGKHPRHTNVVASNFYLPSYEEIRFAEDWTDWDNKKKEVVAKVWDDLAEARKFGSLVRVEQPIRELAEAQSIAKEGLFAGEDESSLFNFRRNAVDAIREHFRRFVQTDAYSSTKINDALTFLDIISQPFDVAVANPPYTDSGDFGPELKTFVEDNYKKPYKFNTNLYAAFIRRCWELTSDTGKVGMIHPHTFMFIKTFEDVRKFLIEKTSINVMVDFGLDRVNLFGPGVLLDATFYTFDKGQQNAEGIYFDITNGLQEKFKKGTLAAAFADLCEGRENARVYRLPQDKLRQIKSWPFIYWISDDFRKKFADTTLDDEFKVVRGIMTGDNNKYLRYYWEIQPLFANDNESWHLYHKGGDYNKWYGNLWLTIHFTENGAIFKAQNKVKNLFSIGVTFGRQSTKGASYRYVDKEELYDDGTACIVGDNIHQVLGFLNSKLNTYIVDALNPTVNTQVGDLIRVPFPSKIKNSKCIGDSVRNIISIKKHLCEFSLIEPLFKHSPIQSGDMSPVENIASYYLYENGLLTQVLLNEAIINREVFDIYELTERDRKMVLDKEGVPVGDLPVSAIARDRYLEFLQLHKNEFPASNELIAHIEALPESDEQPRLEFERLYQKNYDWEEFCIQNKVNPIEAWYQFSVAQVLPAQRTQELAFEFVTDIVRTLLEKDDDGVMPMVDRTGEGMVSERIQAEMIEQGYTGAQYAQVCQLLGMPIEKYLRERFFEQLSNRLNLFMYLPKTPFIWHLTSGPLHAMELLVSIYKWDRNTLSRVKSVYCANREASLTDRLATLAQSAEPSAQGEAADIRAQLRELAAFTDKLDALLASGYDPKLDDGVGKNIAPLQQLGLLSYPVLKETGGKKSQLNKFLNADW